MRSFFRKPDWVALYNLLLLILALLGVYSAATADFAGDIPDSLVLAIRISGASACAGMALVVLSDLLKISWLEGGPR